MTDDADDNPTDPENRIPIQIPPDLVEAGLLKERLREFDSVLRVSGAGDHWIEVAVERPFTINDSSAHFDAHIEDGHDYFPPEIMQFMQANGWMLVSMWEGDTSGDWTPVAAFSNGSEARDAVNQYSMREEIEDERRAVEEHNSGGR